LARALLEELAVLGGENVRSAVLGAAAIVLMVAALALALMVARVGVVVFVM
jgi:hypothetical protein